MAHGVLYLASTSMKLTVTRVGGGGRPSDIAVGSPPRMTEKDFGGQSSFKPITSLPNLPF